MVVVQSRQEIASRIVADAVEVVDLLMVQDLPDIFNQDSHAVVRRRFWFGSTAIPKQIRCYDAMALVGEVLDLMPPAEGNGGEAMEESNSTFGWRSRLDTDVFVLVARGGHSEFLPRKLRHLADSVSVSRPWLSF